MEVGIGHHGEPGIDIHSEAKPVDKTMIDTLSPAVETFRKCVSQGKSFKDSLDEMTGAARSGCESTRDLTAKIGRASRLGERSRGVIDAGVASCFIILEPLAESIKRIL
jgi:phosphoenolpyruvate---glycerone phosphotransferase subunit DhaL